MCSFSRPRIDPPKPEPIPETPPMVTNATTTRDAPKQASSSSSSASQNTAMKKRRGRGSLRIPLTSSGLSQSGTNFPTS